MLPRTHYFTEQQLDLLEQLSKQTGLTVSELIRRAVDAYVRVELQLLGKESS